MDALTATHFALALLTKVGNLQASAIPTQTGSPSRLALRPLASTYRFDRTNPFTITAKKPTFVYNAPLNMTSEHRNEPT